ncbi:MAG: hypothetical protein ACOC6O_01515 [Chloroflexota bacterium]
MCHQIEYGCGHPAHHVSWHYYPGCCHPAHGVRQFPTKEEVIAWLEDYLGQLQAEAKGVEERLAEFRKGE